MIKLQNTTTINAIYPTDPILQPLPGIIAQPTPIIIDQPLPGYVAPEPIITF